MINETKADIQRLPHAPSDIGSRYVKARKIERLIEGFIREMQQPIQLLEVGTGSGGIAHYFSTKSKFEYQVHSVDVNDIRQVREGYTFIKVEDTVLPFEDNIFDIVISNHVIEHVGDIKSQNHHLQELHRVLKHDGIVYLSVPNRWMLVEPHYRLPFLSWVPKRMRSQYLRLSGKGTVYDCEPLEMSELESMLAVTSFNYENICVQALKETLRLESPKSLAAWIEAKTPRPVMMKLRPLIPTLIYILKKQGE